MEARSLAGSLVRDRLRCADYFMREGYLDRKRDEERGVWAMPISNAQELFVHELGVIYDAEYQFVEGQQEMAQQASDEDLRSAIEEHIGQTEQHIQTSRKFSSSWANSPSARRARWPRDW
jgi:hypothetical protein